MPTQFLPHQPPPLPTLRQRCCCRRRNVLLPWDRHPEGSAIPTETQELVDKLDKDIEKLEKENNKYVTKNVHSATKSLGQNQLKEYKKQQASFREVATNAKSDIGSKECNPGTAIQSHSRCAGSVARHCESQRRAGGEHHGARPGRREAAEPAPRCPAELCSCAGHGDSDRKHTARVRGSTDGEGRRKSAQGKAPSISGALWRTWICWWTSRTWQNLSDGGVVLVRSHSARRQLNCSFGWCLCVAANFACSMPFAAHRFWFVQICPLAPFNPTWKYLSQSIWSSDVSMEVVLECFAWFFPKCDWAQFSVWHSWLSSNGRPWFAWLLAFFRCIRESWASNLCDVSTFEHPCQLLHSCIQTPPQSDHHHSKSVRLMTWSRFT